MDRITRMCEEIHVFAGRAERTGVKMELRGLKTGQRTCTSLTDLIRKYKLYGDGVFYLPAALWPKGETVITLDNVKWMGVERAVGLERGVKRKRTRPARSETD
jgi:hypothetical protein